MAPLPVVAVVVVAGALLPIKQTPKLLFILVAVEVVVALVLMAVQPVVGGQLHRILCQ
jgi:hypothetical protein